MHKNVYENDLEFEYTDEIPVKGGKKVKGIIRNTYTGKDRHFCGYYMDEPKPEGYFLFLYSDDSIGRKIEKSADKAYEGYRMEYRESGIIYG